MSEGCMKVFRRKQGWVGRPNNTVCIEGNLCSECLEKMKEVRK